MPKGLIAFALSPKNAVEVARVLLDAGAEVDATSHAYGGGWTALGQPFASASRTRLAPERTPSIAAPRSSSRSMSRICTHDVVKYLLDRGVDVAAATGWTALHSATGSADLRIIDLLIRRGAPLEQTNMYGGTVLGQAVWFAHHGDPAKIGTYARVIDVLIAAGARTDASPKMMDRIEEVRRRAGGRAG